MKISSLSDQNGREHNQDRKLVIPKTFSDKKVLFCMVADGMGGTDAGGEASLIATAYFEKWVEEEMSKLLLQQSRGSYSNILRSSIEKAFNRINEEILAYGEKNKVSLGTTTVILILFQDEYLVANLGDSRAYLFSPSSGRSIKSGNSRFSVLRITRDQTAIQSSIDKGIISEEDAKKSKLSHVLTSCLGMKPSKDGKIMMRPEFYRGTFRKGDHFLLCSDGLYNRVDAPEMTEVIKKNNLSTKEKLMELFIKSKEAGEKDNITGILVEV